LNRGANLVQSVHGLIYLALGIGGARILLRSDGLWTSGAGLAGLLAAVDISVAPAATTTSRGADKVADLSALLRATRLATTLPSLTALSLSLALSLALTLALALTLTFALPLSFTLSLAFTLPLTLALGLALTRLLTGLSVAVELVLTSLALTILPAGTRAQTRDLIADTG
jgi:hypothetical protein